MIRSIPFLILAWIASACTPAPTPTPTIPPSASATASPAAVRTAVPTQTATPTPTPTSLPSATATVTAVPTTVATSTLIEGWLVYQNDLIGYEFSYPPQAEITSKGANSRPSDEELPPNMTPVEYLAQLRRTYPDDLCVVIQYDFSFVIIQAPPDQGGKYATPCGVTGVGDYDLIAKTETVIIDGRPYAARGWEVHERNEDATFLEEFFILQLEDGMRIDYGGTWARAGAFHTDYLPVKEILLQILASLRITK